MKITISPSADQSDEAHPYYSVTVEHPADDPTAERMVEMFWHAMQAAGFSREITTKAIQEFEA